MNCIQPKHKKPYFLTRVYIQAEENVQSAFLEPVFLEMTPKSFEQNSEDIINLNRQNHSRILRNIGENEDFQEGTYVSFRENASDITLASAENEPLVISFLENYQNILTDIEINTSERDTNIIPDENVANVYTYHVNVGHGNTSFLIIEYHDSTTKVICIDCSVAHQGSEPNIQACIDHISKKFNIDHLNIDIFVLTHPHYDHYSGLQYLITKKYITTQTEIWLNHKYSTSPSSFYAAILHQLVILKCKFVFPIRNISTSNIRIWYPEKTIQNKGVPSKNLQIEPNPNNASIVIQFKFNDTSILFTGDIETLGWDQMNCPKYMDGVQFYCISHHGSLNGHKRNKCHHGQCITNVVTCPNDFEIAILMGKDKAYKGIYSPTVLNDFSSSNIQLLRTEEDLQGQKNIKFLEIELFTRKWNYY